LLRNGLTLAVLLAWSTAAASTTVETFLARSEALQARGFMAMFSSDVGVLREEMQDSVAALRLERQQAIQAGRQPAFCPPERASTTSSELLGYFRTIPAPLRARMEVRDGLRGFMARKYPCPTRAARPPR
jgi:hypothetical protein